MQHKCSWGIWSHLENNYVLFAWSNQGQSTSTTSILRSGLRRLQKIYKTNQKMPGTAIKIFCSETKSLLKPSATSYLMNRLKSILVSHTRDRFPRFNFYHPLVCCACMAALRCTVARCCAVKLNSTVLKGFLCVRGLR